jgi:hypothetical protein
MERHQISQTRPKGNRRQGFLVAHKASSRRTGLHRGANVSFHQAARDVGCRDTIDPVIDSWVDSLIDAWIDHSSRRFAYAW